MPSAQTSLAALLLLLALVSEASAKMETKKWDREPLTDGPTYRTDMCAISQKVIDGEVKLRDALIGLNLSLIIRDYPLFFNINENGTINDGGYPGLIPRLLDDVAGRGGFRWRNSWGMMKHPAPKSWTEMLVWGVEHYDICAERWNNEEERMRAGVSFPKGFNDNTRIMVTRARVEEPTMDFAGPYSPFTPELWLCCVGLFIFSAITYYILERNSEEDLNFDDEPTNYFQSFFLTIVNFTGGGGGGYAPRTHAGMMFATSLQWWCLLTIAAYTANLAAALISKSGSSYGVTSIQDAITRQVPVCAKMQTADGDLIRRVYPTMLVEPCKDVPEMYAKLNAGACAGLVTSLAAWGLEEIDPDLNPRCKNQYVGRSFNPVANGFGVKSESAGKCSSIIRDALDIFMSEMINDGKLAEYFEEQYAEADGQSCAATARRSSTGNHFRESALSNEAVQEIPVPGNSKSEALREASRPGWLSKTLGVGSRRAESEDDSGISSMTLLSMASLFVVHGIATLVALTVHFCSGERRVRVLQMLKRPLKMLTGRAEDDPAGLEAAEKGEEDNPTDDLNASLQQRMEKVESRLQSFQDAWKDESSRRAAVQRTLNLKIQALMTHLAVPDPPAVDDGPTVVGAIGHVEAIVAIARPAEDFPSARKFSVTI